MAGACSAGGDALGQPISVITGRRRSYAKTRPCHYRGGRFSRCLRTIPASGSGPDRMDTRISKGYPHDLKVLLCNARSMIHKTTAIHDLIMDGGLDLACVTETWLDEADGPVLAAACPPGFSYAQQPRSCGRGGGVAVIFRKSLVCTRRPIGKTQFSECMFWKLGNRGSTGFLLVYRPPRCTKDSLPELLQVVADVLLETPSLVVLGDFNIHADTTLQGAARDFVESMASMGLSLNKSGPTHSHGHALDLVFTSMDVGDLTLSKSETKEVPWSDHFLVQLDFSATHPLCREVGPIQMVRPRHLMDPNGFQRVVGDALSHVDGLSADPLVARWNVELTRAIDCLAPKRPLRLHGARTAPWFSTELRAMKQSLRRLERRWRITHSESDRTQVKAQRRAYQVAIATVKKNFFTASIASAENSSRRLFQVVHNLAEPPATSGPSTGHMFSCNDFAKFFADKIAQIREEVDSTVGEGPGRESARVLSSQVEWDQFQSVTSEDVDRLLGRVKPTTCLLDPCPSWLIKASREGLGDGLRGVVNASLREGAFPDPLKEAVIKPLLKKPSLDAATMANYRPVSNLPFLGKVIERAVAEQLQARLEEADHLDPFQSGFRPHHGTETALVALVDDLRRARDKGESCFLVLLDLSAAFDTIDHNILLDRLQGLGAGGTVIQWFRSFLLGRVQKVVVGDECSDPWALTCGVPQGSVLSPMLFNIYMKPLGEIIRGFGLGVHQYADDTQLYLSFKSEPVKAVKVLCECLEAVGGWMAANRLRLNPDKTEVLFLGDRTRAGVEDSLVLNGVTVPLKDQVRSLGVILDSQLSMEAQVKSVSRAAVYQLHLARRLRPYLPADCLTRVVHALVISRLDYCNALYVGLPLKVTRKLQLIQNAAARLVTGGGRRDHITPVLKDLHWLPVRFRAQFKVLVLTFKALNGLGPVYLKERLHPHHSARTLRSSAEGLLAVPSLREAKLQGTRQRAFSVVAPTLWNALPADVKAINNYLTFRRHLKAALFREVFN
uniref:Reverse transcriptase domain-containing protein n=1 Tax=Podarcis muralis TaxID=64176 RepID=A0A670I7A7_PODMU